MRKRRNAKRNEVKEKKQRGRKEEDRIHGDGVNWEERE